MSRGKWQQKRDGCSPEARGVEPQTATAPAMMITGCSRGVKRANMRAATGAAMRAPIGAAIGARVGGNGGAPVVGNERPQGVSLGPCYRIIFMVSPALLFSTITERETSVTSHTSEG